jgi:2-amino-4-hydroxy-6-hydroxymethyldihydropteridine diphosphokinase
MTRFASYHSFAGDTTITHAWIGVGANLGVPSLTLERLHRWLIAIPTVEVEAVAVSRWTEPWGPPQPMYLNTVMRVRTLLAPFRLLGVLQNLEMAAGRQRNGELRWGPRLLDLDLLMWGAICMDSPGLTLPHPGLATRPFVLEPMCDIDPDLIHPVLDRSMQDLLQAAST